MLDAADYLAARLQDDVARVLFQVLTESVIGGQEEPGIEPRLDGRQSRDVRLRESVVGIMHRIGTAGLVAEANGGRPAIHDDLVAGFRNLTGGERGRGR